MEFLLILVPLTALFVLILFLAMVFEKTVEDRLRAIRSIYVYTVSLISLCVVLIGTGMIAYTALSHTVFPRALDQDYTYRLMNCETFPVKSPEVATGYVMTETDKATCLEREQKAIAIDREARFQSQMLSGIIMVLLALPMYVLHFFVLRRREA